MQYSGYVRDLLTSLLRSHGVSHGDILMKINAEDIFLNIDTAIPCGLIINEIVSNSLKHAFPQGRKGEIRIDFHAEKDGRMVLIVGDNGIGFPKGRDFRNANSLGLQLIGTLADQLKSTMELKRSHGTEFEFTF